METEKDYLKDIQDIRQMMAQSSQFISLSGFSGVLAGIYALIGAYVAHRVIESDTNYYIDQGSNAFTQLVVIAGLVLVASLVTAFIFTVRKAKKMNETIWNPVSLRLLINFCIPLCSGGLFGLLLIEKGYLDLVAPVTLIFYGLACINASKFTLRDVRYLGITLVLLGLVSVYFTGYELYFWALGFGVCHILYGAMMHYKYDR